MELTLEFNHRISLIISQKNLTPVQLESNQKKWGSAKTSMEVTILHIPHTKAAPIEGEDVYWSQQYGPTDPYEALTNHQHINNPGDDDHLFTYLHKGHLQPLTKHAFIKQVAKAACAARLEPLQGHRIRIGATLFYLLCSVPFEAMKVMG